LSTVFTSAALSAEKPTEKTTGKRSADELSFEDTIGFCDERGAYGYVVARGALLSWDFSTIPVLSPTEVDELYDKSRAKFSGMPEKEVDSELKDLTKVVLSAIAPTFNQTIWRETVPVNDRKVLYPDLASLDIASSLKDNQIDWSQFKLLFEVEPGLIDRRNSRSRSKLRKTVAETGEGQWFRWVTQLPSTTDKVYGAVTNYEYWIFLTGTKSGQTWQFYHTKPQPFIGKGGIPKFIEPSKSAFGYLCRLFAVVNKK
jgi:hypothetical protein